MTRSSCSTGLPISSEAKRSRLPSRGNWLVDLNASDRSMAFFAAGVTVSSTMVLILPATKVEMLKR